LGIKKTLAVEMIGDRTGIIAGHLPLIISIGAACRDGHNATVDGRARHTYFAGALARD
jgi:hypothetical protein